MFEFLKNIFGGGKEKETEAIKDQAKKQRASLSNWITETFHLGPFGKSIVEFLFGEKKADTGKDGDPSPDEPTPPAALSAAPTGSVSSVPFSTGRLLVTAGTGNAVPNRDNNPFNIKAFGSLEELRVKYGDPGLTIDPALARDGGRFIKFSNPSLGLMAAVKLLRRGYNNLEFGAAMRRWSGGGYGSEIAPEYAGRKIVDISDSQLIADIFPKQAKREGFNGQILFS